jgi:ribosomal-protein-alanine N-acetyltransferase
MAVAVRLVEDDDVGRLTELLVANRAFLAPWEPERSPDFFTEDRQRQLLSEALAGYQSGTAAPLVIVDDQHILGRINLSDIVRGPFQSAHLGYWVDQSVNGRGVATAAVAATARLAFEQLGLHRLQAGTLVHNAASQRVLTRNGFTRIGLAPRYLRIAGRWQDHILYQRLDDSAHVQDPT